MPADAPPATVSRLAPALAARIVEKIRREALPVGHRLTEQSLCDELGVSRSPVRKALQYLATTGVVGSVPNKGYQVAKPASVVARVQVRAHEDSDEALYMAIADDRLAGELASDVNETELMERYEATRLQVQRVLHRMAREGIVERKPARGWAFLPLLNTPQAYRESYRFRMIIEPASLLEPGYAVDAAELENCYRQQCELLGGAIEKWPRLECLAKLDRAKMRQQCEEHLVLIDLVRRGERVEASHFLRQHLDGARQGKTGVDRFEARGSQRAPR